MSSVDGVLIQYRNLTGQHLQELWDQVVRKQGIKVDVLRDILMFYFQHKVFLPPPQKVYDALLAAFVAKGTSKKMRNILFHIIEELSLSFESSILETMRFSTNSISAIELSNCVLIGRYVQELDASTVDKLLAYLTSNTLDSEESGKLLVFLNRVAVGHPSVLPKDFVKNLGELMAEWLCNCRAVVSSSSQFFGRADKTGGSEVDGTQLTAGDIFTVLTLANTFSKKHMLGVQCFSVLGEWLDSVEPQVGKQTERGLLVGVVREYCNLCVRQCLRPAQSDHDRSLQKAVLCQVVDVLTRLVQLDKSQHLQSLLIVKRVHRSVVENFRSDPRDVSILVRLLKFLLHFGEAADNPQPMCEHFLGDIVHRSYSSDLAAFDISDFLVSGGLQSQSALLHRYFPNLLKLVACHPSSLVEEFMILVPHFVEPHTAIEVFHSLVDLPLLSATLCLHQVRTVLRHERTTTALSPSWSALVDGAESPALQPSFLHVLRKERAGHGGELPARSYVKAVGDLAKHSLAVSCSRIVPVLLEAFFMKVEALGDEQVNADLLCAILKKIRLLYGVPGYSTIMHKTLTEHFQELVQNNEDLVWMIQADLIAYACVLDNHEVCPRLYCHVVWLMGTVAPPRGQTEQLGRFYETLECVLYEMLAQITSEEKVSLHLLGVMCSSLAKLASRSQDLIPRLLLCFSKVQRQVATRLHNVTEDEKQAVHDRLEELITFLKNPNIASPSLSISSSHETDPAMTAFLQILAQVTAAR